MEIGCLGQDISMWSLSCRVSFVAVVVVICISYPSCIQLPDPQGSDIGSEEITGNDLFLVFAMSKNLSKWCHASQAANDEEN